MGFAGIFFRFIERSAQSEIHRARVQGKNKRRRNKKKLPKNWKLYTGEET